MLTMTLRNISFDFGPSKALAAEIRSLKPHIPAANDNTISRAFQSATTS